MAAILKQVGANVEIVASSPEAMLRIPDGQGFKDISFRNFASSLSVKNRLKLMYLTVKSMFVTSPKGSFKNWFFPFIDDPWLIKMADSFCGWSLSMTCDKVPAEEMLAIIKHLYRYGGPGIPVGGCGAVIDALETVILSGGGEIHTSSQVNRILITDGRATGVETSTHSPSADVIISDIGHKATMQLYDQPLTDEFKEYYTIVNKTRPSEGIKICLGTDKPLIGHSGVLLTPYARRINGINEVSNTDPSFAPKGKHLVMSHQVLRSNDIHTEIMLGLDDLRELFPDEDYEVLMVQTYRNDWPVNRAGSGSYLGNTTPVAGLYVVGDGAKGKGGMEVEGIAMGVDNTMRFIE
jgi:phytoene dehydrogenase-like protein